MRTTGNFTDIYLAARDYSMITENDKPLNAVIRKEGDLWMLESGLEPTDGDFEISLDHFDTYFWESYRDPEYTPSETDINDFMNYPCGNE